MIYAAERKEIFSRIDTALPELNGMATHGQLYFWAQENGLADALRFDMFKKRLMLNEVDYVGLRTVTEKFKELQMKANYQIRFRCDARDDSKRFAIVDKDNKMVQIGLLFDTQRCFGEAYLDAVKMCIAAAVKAKELYKTEVLKLILNIDYNNFPKLIVSVGKMAYTENILLSVVKDTSPNAASELLNEEGHRRISQGELFKLVEPVPGKSTF